MLLQTFEKTCVRTAGFHGNVVNVSPHYYGAWIRLRNGSPC
jgi:hypothetical protein